MLNITNILVSNEVTFLLGLTFIPLFTSLVLFFIRGYDQSHEYRSMKIFSYFSGLFTLLLTFLFVCKYFMLLYSADLTTYLVVPIYHFSNLNITFSYLIDAVSLSFVVLTNLLTFLCLKIVSRYTTYVRYFYIIIFAIQFFCLQAFLVDNFFMFYVFFEAILIPMFFMIGIWGSHGRNIHAALVFFLYTLFGSLLMLLGLAYIHTTFGATSFLSFTDNASSLFNFVAMYSDSPTYFFDGDFDVNVILFILFFIAFAVKIPMFPAHIWLPEAHGEAPTVGSVILAGLLLKLGLYGMIRVLIPLCVPSIFALKTFIYLFCLLSIVYTSLTTLAQTDIKRVIAYSSVGHMNMAVLALFSLSKLGFVGAVFSGISHGFVASGLFFCVGLLYDRFGTKLINYFGGVAVFMPLFASIFGFFSFSNIAFPGTSAFASEFLMLAGIGSLGFVVLFLASLGVLLSAFYSIWLMNRILFGPYTTLKNVFSTKFNVNGTFSDLTKAEVLILVILGACIVLFGVYPSLITDLLNGFSFTFLINTGNNLNDFNFYSSFPVVTQIQDLIFGVDVSQKKFEQLYLGGLPLTADRLYEYAQWKSERIFVISEMIDYAQTNYRLLETGKYVVSEDINDLVNLTWVNDLFKLQLFLIQDCCAPAVVKDYNLVGSHYSDINKKILELWSLSSTKEVPYDFCGFKPGLYFKLTHKC